MLMNFIQHSIPQDGGRSYHFLSPPLPVSKSLLVRWYAAQLIGSEKCVKAGPNITQ
jgi:hypothetical protein